MRASAMLRKLWCDDAAVTVVEYAAILALIGAGVAVSVFGLGTQTALRYDEASAAIKP